MALLLSAASLCPAQLKTINEYPLASPNGQPVGITAGPDGALWFVEWGVWDGNTLHSGIERITLAGAISGRFLNDAWSSPSGITAGPDGALWFTEAGNIGRISTAGVITEYPVPTYGTYEWGITAGPDGALWFTEQNGNNIGRITTAGYVTEYPIPTASSGLFYITPGPDGALWFAESSGNNIGRITVAGDIKEYAIPTANSCPMGITVGPDGALWFTEDCSNKIGRITTTGSGCSLDSPCWKEYTIPSANTYPLGITGGPDGALWFTEFGGSIGRITTAGVITEFPVPTANSSLWSITPGPDGTLWFTENTGNNVGRAVPTERHNGIDFSGVNSAPTMTQLNQLRQAGIQYTVAEVSRGTSGVSSSVQELQAFQQAGLGFKTAAYCFLRFDQSSASGDQQVQAGITALGGVGSTAFNEVSFIAIDVEQISKTPAPLQRRLSIISQALQKITSVGKKAVIYTEQPYWHAITNDAICTSAACGPGAPGDMQAYPLWSSTSYHSFWDTAANLHCGDGKPTLMPFTSFDGWNTRIGKQYDIGINSNPQSCNATGAYMFGVQVDLDVFDPSLFQ